MPLASIAAWVLRHQARSPLLWLWAAFFAALWPAVATFTPLGVTTGIEGTPPLLYEIAFIASAVGAVAGMSQIETSRWILGRASALRRTAVEAVILCTAPLPFLLAGLAPAWLLGAGGESWGAAAFAAGAATLAHFGTLALVLLRFPLPTSVRLAALPVLAWALPALVESSGWLASAFLHVFEVARHTQEPDLVGWRSAVLPIIGLLGAAILSAGPHTHALRNPR